MIPQLSLAISPCPNDTFSFYHFIHFPSQQGHFCLKEVTFADIQQLNELALALKPDIVKVSFLVAGELLAKYDLLPSGAAIGYGVGPLLLAPPAGLKHHHSCLRVGLPGRHTSAHLLFEYYAQKTNLRHNYTLEKQYMLFSDIMHCLKQGQLDLGVVIHEGRFVYQQEQLTLWQDLGAFWELHTGYPVPLGAILVRKTLPLKVKQDIATTLQQSVQQALHAFTTYDTTFQEKILPFVRQHAQELSLEVLEAHIKTYVTQETVQLSQQAMAGIDFFWQQSKTLPLAA